MTNRFFLYFEKWRNVAFEIALLTEPCPPKAIEVIKVEQRKISLYITDTDTPNGDIAGYVFKLRYKIYPYTDYMERTTFLSKTASSICDLQHHIVPGDEIFQRFFLKILNTFRRLSFVTFNVIHKTEKIKPHKINSFTAS